jgi:hypothetical protein
MMSLEVDSLIGAHEVEGAGVHRVPTATHHHMIALIVRQQVLPYRQPTLFILLYDAGHIRQTPSN